MSTRTSDSGSRPRAKTTLESSNNATIASDSGPDPQKNLDSKGGVSKTAGSKTRASKTSESKTRATKAAASKDIVPKPTDSGSSISNKDSPFVTPKTSDSRTNSRITSESKSGRSSASSSRTDSKQTEETSSNSSKSSGSMSGVSKWSSSKSSPSTTSDSKSEATESGRDASSTSKSQRRTSTGSVEKYETFESLSETQKVPEPGLISIAPLSKAMNFLKAYVPIFSWNSSQTPASDQLVMNSQKQSESASALLNQASTNPASDSPVASTTSGEYKPGRLPDRFAWSRASYSAPSSLSTTQESATDTTNELYPISWLSNPAALDNAQPSQPAADTQGAVSVSPHITSLMAMNARRRPSTPGPGRRKSSVTKGFEVEVSRSRSGSRDSRSDSITAKHIKQKISFQTRADPDEPFPAPSFMAWDVETPVALYMASTGPLAQPPVTVMTALQLAAVKHPNKPAYGVKDHGGWKTITYKQLLDAVNQVAAGFMKLGLERHNTVAIYGHNSVEWVVSHLAAIFAGGISASMHVTSSDEDCLLYAKQIKCRIIVAGSANERTRVLVFRSQLKHRLTVVQCSKEDFEKSEDVYSWDELLEMGQDVSFEVLHERAMQQAPNVCCSIVQTSGSGGPPKIVMLSHDNVTWASNSIGRNLSVNTADGVTVSFMPLSYIVAQVMDIYMPIRFGITVYFTPETAIEVSVLDIIREVRPTLFWGTSRLYDILLGAIEASWSRNVVKKMLRKWAIKIGLKGHVTRGQNRSRPMGWKLANSFVCSRIREEFGLDRCVEIMLAGVSVQPQVWNFYYGLNMDLLMSYGMTESTGQHTMSTRDRHRMRSVGLEMNGCMTMIEKANEERIGELLLKGRNIAMGYLNMEEKTLASFTDDGWFRTGDLGKRDEDGFLYVAGRIDEQIHLSTGDAVLPVDIETSVSHHLPCVLHCMAVGNNRPFLGLLMTLKTKVNPDTGRPTSDLSEEAVRWFRKSGFRVSTVGDVIPKATKRMLSRVQLAIDRVNAKTPKISQRIIRWTFLPEQFTIETGEIGQSLKIRRWVVEEKYRSTIESLFA